MANEESGKTGLSKEAWGAIATITVALITAGVTLTTHYWSPNEKHSDSGKNPSVASTSAPADSSPPATTNAIAGRWAGNASDANGGSFKIEIEITQDCSLDARCGTISVSHVPCRGTIYLTAVQQGDYEFRVDNFVAPSTSACTPGGGEHFQLAADGTLLYTTTYDPKAHATLTRQN